MDTLTAADEEAAAEELYSSRCTDGLPIVVPTPDRVERMLAYGAAVESDMVIGKLAPAGEAIADPLFDLGPIQTCTHSVPTPRWDAPSDSS